MDIFQYPNQQNVLRENMERENIGKKIRFTIYDKKRFPITEKVGEIISVNQNEYIAKCGKKIFAVSKCDYISIF